MTQQDLFDLKQAIEMAYHTDPGPEAWKGIYRAIFELGRAYQSRGGKVNQTVHGVEPLDDGEYDGLDRLGKNVWRHGYSFSQGEASDGS